MIISQSGETADSLAALRKCKENGIRTLGIVNVVGSSIAREADNVFYTLAGPEISVATTKAYSTQLIAAYTPVSYTHLDVYKRQVSDRSGTEGIRHYHEGHSGNQRRRQPSYKRDTCHPGNP